MELRQYFSVIWKWLWLILISVIVAGGASYYATSQQPKLYQTTAKLMVGQSIQITNPNAGDINTSNLLAQTYTQIIKTSPVLQGAIDTLGIKTSVDALRGQVSASQIQGTQLMDVRAVDTDPKRAALIANEVAHQLMLQGPAGQEAENSKQRDFLRSQADDLQKKIVDGQQQLKQLQDSLQVVTSARELADKKSQISKMQSDIAGWQQSYASMVNYISPRSPNILTLIEPAQVPGAPFAPNLPLNVGLAAVIGLALAVGAAFLVEYLDDSIRNTDDIQRVLHLSSIGTIAQFSGPKGDMLITANEPRASVSEAFRVLRTNIQFSGIDRPIKTVLVTSANPVEGKSVIASNLAVVMAQAGLKTVLVDCDLRKPRQHKIFGLANDNGLSNTLLAHGPVDSAIRTTRVENLRLLTSGAIPPNPAELLGSASMASLKERLESEADILIIDSPPSLAVADSAILARMCDGVVLVVDSGHTRWDAAQRSKQVLENAGGRILGVVVNRLTGRSRGYYNYYRYYAADGSSGKHSKSARTPQPSAFSRLIGAVTRH